MDNYSKTKETANRIAVIERLADSPDGSRLHVYPRSIAATEGAVLFLARQGASNVIGVVGQSGGLTDAAYLLGTDNGDQQLRICPATAANVAVLRQILPHLMPKPLGLAKSIGLGDRLGLATPGHADALRAYADGDMAPIFAQQSVRENSRTGRTPQQVLDDATLGAFQAGWQEGYGADADHLKCIDDVDEHLAVGYSFYTIDSGDHVQDRGHTATGATLQKLYDALPWEKLASTAQDTVRRYADVPFDLESFRLTMTGEQVRRAAVKYGAAVAHTITLARHIASRRSHDAYEIELSLDETEHPTSLPEHLFIAAELKRLGVEPVSLAPRYPGHFEKGVDYIGDPEVFANEFKRHLAIARKFGPYKLSLHSGSDKFTLYPIVARLSPEGAIHLKTAGTSYLEALRAIAVAAPDLFRRILRLGHQRFDTDRATYHLSGDQALAPNPQTVTDAQLTTLLDEFHTRQILHVTFGSILQDPQLKSATLAVLRAHEDLYHDMLVSHFAKHISPFTAGKR